MKTLIFFILFILVCASILSQNITNTLGTSGLFTIKDGATNYLSLSQSTGQVNILKTLRLENTTSSTIGVIFMGPDRFLHNYHNVITFGENTFLGINAGNFTMSGSGTLASYNTGIGSNSLTALTTGRYNTALGYQSLYQNATGGFNTALGVQTLFSNTSGEGNTAVGWQSSYFTTGNHNTAVGYESLRNNFTGYENTAVGFRSLSGNTGYGNTAVGYLTLTASNNSFQNTAVGHHSLQGNSGNYNTALGYNAGSNVTTGYNLTLLGIDANPSNGDSHDQITLGNVFVTQLRCAVTTITSLSDARDKKNVKDLSLGLDFISKLKPRQFNWDKREWYDDNVSDGSKMKESPTAGFIAQELDEVQTTANAEWLNLVLKDNPEKWEATPGNLLPIMVKAIQELKTENDNLKSEIESLKTVKERLAKLEQIILELNQLKEIKSTEK